MSRRKGVRRLIVPTVAVLTLAALLLLGFAAYILAGVRAGTAEESGEVRGMPVFAPVTIARDERGIPHIRARNVHDAFVAEGYAQASDRLFQLDLYRRLVSGRLSEILGPLTLQSDLAARVVDVDAIARAELAALAPADRAELDAFAEGVNAAIARRPLPPEFRVLGYRPEPWRAEDSLIATFSTVLALTDSWDDVAMRADVISSVGPKARDAFFSITDPAYDSPTVPRIPAPVASLPALTLPFPNASPLPVAFDDAHAGRGSNDFVAGSALTTTHRALLGNDPHLSLHMPGVWWLVDIDAPSFHVAGATLAGVPGVVLGHNEHLAWGATNGTVATVRVFRERFVGSELYLVGKQRMHASHRRERFFVRFSKPVVRDYLRTRHGFVFAASGSARLAAAWTADVDRRSPLVQFTALDRARSVADAEHILARYPGPPQNFVLADDRGYAGYVLAGNIPLDPAWGLTEHDGPTSPSAPAPNVAYAALPQLPSARTTFAFTANDRVYGRGYPYRLSAAFSPPYRAARIAQLLTKPPYDVARFSAVQSDVMSLAERELAARIARALARAKVADADTLLVRKALVRFDGRFTPNSRAAVYVNAVRLAATQRLVRMHLPAALAVRYLTDSPGTAYVALMRALRGRPRGWVPQDDYDGFLVASVREAIATMRADRTFGATWGDVGARTAPHALAGLGFSAWNGVRFPGLGDAYSTHVQTSTETQSFRAVWDVGQWESGGIVIPQGESGEPGSPHYRDAAPLWLRERLVAFPFDRDAVAHATRVTLELRP